MLSVDRDVKLEWTTGSYWKESSDGKAALSSRNGVRSASSDVAAGTFLRLDDVFPHSLYLDGFAVLFTGPDSMIVGRAIPVSDGDATVSRLFRVPSGASRILVNTRQVATIPSLHVMRYHHPAIGKAVEDASYADLSDWSSHDRLVDTLKIYNSDTVAVGSAEFVCRKEGAGVVTNEFDADGRVFCHMSCVLDRPATIRVMQGFKSDGMHYRNVEDCRTSAGPWEEWFEFDSTSQKVYDAATGFSLLLQTRGFDGDLTVSDVEIRACQAKDWETDGVWSPNLRETIRMANREFISLGRSVDDLASLVSEANVLTSPDGTRWRLRVSDDGAVSASRVNATPKKILAIGNSITGGWLTGKGPDVFFGMAASAKDKDWASLVAERYGAELTRLHCAKFEQCETLEDARAWISGNRARFAGYDCVVAQIGDNVNTTARLAVFKESLPLLVDALSSTGAEIVLAGAWFNSYLVQDTLASAASKARVRLADISDLSTDKDNQSSVGSAVTCPDGSTFAVNANECTHPGDKGMRLIADRIIGKLEGK